MKVCYYNHTGKVSGAEKVLFTLLANVGPGFEPSLIAPDTAPHSGILPEPWDQSPARR